MKWCLAHSRDQHLLLPSPPAWEEQTASSLSEEVEENEDSSEKDYQVCTPNLCKVKYITLSIFTALLIVTLYRGKS